MGNGNETGYNFGEQTAPNFVQPTFLFKLLFACVVVSYIYIVRICRRRCIGSCAGVVSVVGVVCVWWLFFRVVFLDCLYKSLCK